MPNALANQSVSPILAAMPDGIGDLTLGAEEWVAAAHEILTRLVHEHADSLRSGEGFTVCEVGHNAPAYLHCGGKLAWNFTIDGASVNASTGELDANECDLKIEGDHSIMSNLARIVKHGTDPKIAAVAQARLAKLSRWSFEGSMTTNTAIHTVLGCLHDEIASRTMPRFVFMTPEWVSSARHILSTRAASEKYASALRGVDFTFSEEFTDTPKYAFPDGSHGGFWVRVVRGQITVGAGPLPSEFEPADYLTKGQYTPVVPVGRTVNAAMTDADKEGQVSYSRRAFRPDADGSPPVSSTSPTGRQMPPELGRIFLPLHDELSKRTSGELPCDFDDSLKPEWSSPPPFDRDDDYDPSWVQYGLFDVYGNPR